MEVKMAKKKKIMILDNNLEFIILLKNYINVQKDMEVVFYACDGTNAMKYIKGTSPDILLLDIVMHENNGFDVLEKINKEPKCKMPLVFVMSSISNEKIIQKAVSLGITYYFIKPFNIKNFINRIRYLMIP